MGSFFRRPLGLFVAIVVVGIILIGVGMTAFGGTSSPSAGSYHAPKPLTPAQFRRAGVRVCLSARSLARAIKVNGKARNLRDVRKDFRMFTPRFDRLIGEFDGLVPPRSAASSFRRMRRMLDAVNRDWDQLDHFAATGQWRRFVLFARSTFRKDIRRLGPPTRLRDIHCGQVSHTTV
jgi:hypothetical protein